MSTSQEKGLSGRDSENVQMSRVKSAEYKMPVYRKLLLTAVMLGLDVCVAFAHMYEVPLLQILGVPVTYLPLCPLVTGPLSLILMSVLSRISDKGPNHQKRKMAVMVLLSAVLLAGIAVLAAANFLLLSNGKHTTKTKVSNCTSGGDGFGLNNNTTLIECTGDDSTDSMGSLASGVSRFPHEERQLPDENDTEGITDIRSLPFTAVLGVVGFVLFDTGYDVSIASTRACVLACSPKDDHTSILILALVMGALGGCINISIGLADYAAILGISRDRLAVKTTVQLCVCCLLLVICLTSTLVTAHFNLKHLEHQRYNHDNTAHDYEDGYGTFLLDRETHKTAKAAPHRNPGFDDHFEDTSSMDEECDSVTSNGDATSDHSSISLIQQHDNDDLSETTDTFVPYDSLPKGSDDAESKPITRDLLCYKVNKRKFSFIIACISFYLGTSVAFSYNLYAPDFLGKEVMGGDSTAAEGSPALQVYEDGVAIASGGLLLCYCCYLAASIVHTKLLDFWGLRVDFCLPNAIMATVILCLMLSKQVAVYYVANVAYGFQRSALLSVPYIVTDNYIHSQDKPMESSVVGKMVGVMTCMVPLNYCTMFLISGPLITLTQYEGSPLLLASLSSYMAALIFLMYKH